MTRQSLPLLPALDDVPLVDAINQSRAILRDYWALWEQELERPAAQMYAVVEQEAAAQGIWLGAAYVGPPWLPQTAGDRVDDARRLFRRWSGVDQRWNTDRLGEVTPLSWLRREGLWLDTYQWVRGGAGYEAPWFLTSTHTDVVPFVDEGDQDVAKESRPIYEVDLDLKRWHDPVTRWQQARYNLPRAMSRSRSMSRAWAAQRDALQKWAEDSYRRVRRTVNEVLANLNEFALWVDEVDQGEEQPFTRALAVEVLRELYPDAYPQQPQPVPAAATHGRNFAWHSTRN